MVTILSLGVHILWSLQHQKQKKPFILHDPESLIISVKYHFILQPRCYWSRGGGEGPTAQQIPAPNPFLPRVWGPGNILEGVLWNHS